MEHYVFPQSFWADKLWADIKSIHPIFSKKYLVTSLSICQCSFVFLGLSSASCILSSILYMVLESPVVECEPLRFVSLVLRLLTIRWFIGEGGSDHASVRGGGTSSILSVRDWGRIGIGDEDVDWWSGEDIVMDWMRNWCGLLADGPDGSGVHFTEFLNYVMICAD